MYQRTKNFICRKMFRKNRRTNHGSFWLYENEFRSN
jgi:hypothetical protein